MKKTVLIVGNSELSFFVAKQLGSALGELVHLDIIWLTNTEKIYPIAHKPFSIKSKVRAVKIRPAKIKSVNLNDRRVITDKKTYQYDLIFIDQTPVFTSKEYDKINDQFETLISTVRSKENRGVSSKAKISFDSENSYVNQLALKLANRRMSDSSASVADIRVEVSSAKGKLSDFFRENRIFSRKSQYPGMVVKSPLPVLSRRKIRGIRLDLKDYPILLATGEPSNQQNVIIIDSEQRTKQSIARSDWNLAKQITHNLLAKLEGGLEKPLDYSGEKIILSSSRSNYVKLGDMESSRSRANVTLSLEKRFWRKLI